MILASSSPRREKLLRQVGIPFTIDAPNVDEYSLGASVPGEVAVEAARLKSEDVVPRYAGRPYVVLSADTIIAVDGEVVGKPRDLNQAREILLTLRGCSHEVLTAFILTDCITERSETELVRTGVTFRPFSDRLLDWYLMSGEPLEKAGAYGIQGLGALLVSEIKGDYYSVVGLPICKVVESLERLGLDVWGP